MNSEASLDGTGQPREEVLRVWHPAGGEHRVHACFAAGPRRAILVAGYVGGEAAEEGTVIVDWSASYEPPEGNDTGSVYLGDGRIDMHVSALRGIGLGSLLVRPLIAWMKTHPSVPVQPIELSGEDARTVEARDRRNRFSEKLGFVFKYQENGVWGESVPMMSSALVLPPAQLSRGWTLESVEGKGQVF